MGDIAAYGGLFVAAFLAATVFPAQSEAVLLALVATGDHALPALLVVASTGNILGSMLNWALGCGIEGFRHRKWFPVSDAALEKAQTRYARYGRWSLLLSWVPIIGDPITIVAGIMRERLLPFLLLVGIAKTGRYLVLVAIYLGFFS